jgi:hypothetical protein
LIEDGDKTAISLNMKIQEQALELSGKMGLLSGLLKQWDVSSSHFPLDLNLTLNGKIQATILLSYEPPLFMLLQS